MKTGIEIIADERLRQVEQEGFTFEHDDQYTSEELETAAGCYIISAEACHYRKNNLTFSGGYRPGEGVPHNWPWHSDWWKPTGDPVRDLAKAGALIAAAIDRLQRLNSQNQ